MNTISDHETKPCHTTGVIRLSISRWIVIGLLCSISVTICGVIFAGGIYKLFFPFIDRELAGPITVSSEWIEISPKDSLHAQRQIQMVVLDLDKSIRQQKRGWGVVLPDGSVVNPEVQLVAEDGQVYELKNPSFWWNHSTGVLYRQFSSDDLPKDKVFRSVRIRSDKPVRCNRIFWRNYNQWDVS